MKQLLFLAHRIPFPPNKGDKIRSFHLLRHLAQRYTVHLGAFVDDPNDWRHADAIRQLCSKVKLLPFSPMQARLKAAAALLAGGTLTDSCYHNGEMARWVREIGRTNKIDCVFVFSSSMAQYALDMEDTIRVIDFVDVDSDKWRQYAGTRVWPMSWIYKREAQLLLAHERRIASLFDASLFVSAAEAQLFRSLAPENADRIGHFNNGVDANYFSPSESGDSPYPADVRPIVFTGAMNYWPNVDAVVWFAREVLPAIRQAQIRASFYIVGANPAREVQALSRMPGVHVTHAVPDVRPWIGHACVSVAPLRIARGIQNKVLEAMAMAKVVVASPEALEGIEASDGNEVLLARDATSFAQKVLSVLAHGCDDIGTAARACILRKYGWAENLARVEPILVGASTNAAPAGMPAPSTFARARMGGSGP